MFIIDYIWVQDFKNSKIQSQTNIVKLEDSVKTLINNVHLIPLIKVPDRFLTLKPIYVIKNPFTEISNRYIVLCEVYNSDISNNRLNCELTLTKHYPGNYYFNIDQEFVIEDPNLRKIKIDEKFFNVGDFFSKHRDFTNEFVDLCINADIPIESLYNSQLNKWSYRLSGINGTTGGDIVWMTRYILMRMSESRAFTVKFGNMKIGINDISNSQHSSADPYLTISVIISTIHKVKSERELDLIKKSGLKDTINEQLIMKEEIRKEAEKLQDKLAETYELEKLEIRERNELDKWNKIKDHSLHIQKLRDEAKELEKNKLEREEQIRLQLLKRQEMEELERVMLLKEKDRQSIIEEERAITDAELTRLRLLREEMDLKKNRENLTTELQNNFEEREKLSIEIQQKEQELEEEERQKEQRKNEEREREEMERIARELDEDYQINSAY